MTQPLDNFIKAAPHGAGRVLVAFAEAESLTDAVAAKLYELTPIEGVPARLFIKALHYSSFVAPRNSEWHIDPEVRAAIREKLAADGALKLAANRLLLEIGKTGDRKLARTELPGYLFTSAGRAFHLAATGQKSAALAEYANSGMGPLSGEQWLAGRLAEEQERAGLIAKGSVEVTFLQAMIFYRTGRRDEALPLFRSLAQRSEDRIEVAIALHLLGKLVERRNPREAEDLYQRAVSMGETLGNAHHTAQVLHSLANLLAHDRSRAGEAEAAYERSVSIVEAFKDDFHIAQTLHSLAILLAGDPSRKKEAEEAFEQSLELGEKLGNEHHIAQTLHSLANLLSRDRSRDVEAERTYRRSIQIGEKIGNDNHVAQTLRSLAGLVEHRSAAEAEALLIRSLEINVAGKNRRGQQLVEESLKKLRKKHPELRKT